MRLHIIGGGSIGMLLAAKLEAYGPLKLLVRTEEQASLIRSTGLVLTDQSAKESLHYIEAAVFEGEVLDDTTAPDWIFLTVKQKDIQDDLLRGLAGQLGERTQVLCFQNGIGHADKLRAFLPEERIWLAVTTEGARRQSLNKVVHTGRGLTQVGRAYPAQAFLPQETPLADERYPLFSEAGLKWRLRDDIWTAVWDKLLVNSVINPLTAIWRLPNGKLLEREDRRELMRELYQEGLQTAVAHGIPTSPDLWETLIQVCQDTSSNHSSMLQDVEKGNETEIAWINGSILEKAREKSLPLPLTEWLVRMVTAL
ncbi:2-dehydropantoate 2-reductase [Gorillibacterium sp. CAU 1737]|uniref:ketopantoate reductase family protein n=1 Tax=Gorillibacterium sp. CAU 1737 TaxID=3140362 RepID=UPI00326126BC